MVVLNNVLQEPTVAYSVVADASGNAKILRFTETPPSGDEIYVVHRNPVSYTHLRAHETP